MLVLALAILMAASAVAWLGTYSMAAGTGAQNAPTADHGQSVPNIVSLASTSVLIAATGLIVQPPHWLLGLVFGAFEPLDRVLR